MRTMSELETQLLKTLRLQQGEHTQQIQVLTKQQRQLADALTQLSERVDELLISRNGSSGP